MAHPQVGDLYTYWCEPNLLFIVTKADRAQVILRRIDNGNNIIINRPIGDRYIPIT